MSSACCRACWPWWSGCWRWSATRRRTRPGPPRAPAPPSAWPTGSGAWAPGWPMAATLHWAFRCGGVSRRAWAPRAGRRRAIFWLGLVLLMAASTALEWSRLYRWESFLPGGHAGGVLGYHIGPASVQWLGFTGSALLALVLMVLGAALVFRFSWGHLAQRLGERIEALVLS